MMSNFSPVNRPITDPKKEDRIAKGNWALKMITTPCIIIAFVKAGSVRPRVLGAVRTRRKKAEARPNH